MKIKEFSSVIFPLFILFGLSLTLLSNDFSFLIGFGFYCILIFLISSLCVKVNNRRKFSFIVALFFLFYSFYATLGHFIFIEDPFKDYFVDIDETKFIYESVLLSELSYSSIWHLTFTNFEYNGSPLFYAWIGTLQKLTGLTPFYGLLFQKLNVVFFGSFIPGIVYLLCNRIVEQKKAFIATIFYGLLSFSFFYSIGLMRDIHIALFYTIGLLIITGNKYTLKNYILLGVLGLMTYFTRVESGLFFVAFLGVWTLNSQSQYKASVYILSLGMLASIIFWIGGVGAISQTAVNTVDNYAERGVAHASQESIGVKLNYLPIPFNYISKTAFGQISPFPFWVHLSENKIWLQQLFYLPQAIAGLFWFLVWTRIFMNYKKALFFFKEHKWTVILSLFYITIVSTGQALPRRLMAVYPVIFMGYLFIGKKIFNSREIIIALASYLLLLLIYAVLKL